jgi:hypothetical protein
MIEYNNTKITSNEYAKLFLVDCINVVESELDDFIRELSPDFDEFSERELNEFKEQFSKKIISVKNTLGYDKLIKKVGK